MSLIEDIRVIPSGGRELRRFGLVLGCALALAGGYCIWRGRWCALPACAAAAAILIAGAAMPRLLLPLQKAWMALALALG